MRIDDASQCRRRIRANRIGLERNQGWIDGGMFAMSLIYAFHALGIGTCCLNWAVDSRTDRTLRSVVSMPDHEAVIMM